MADIGFGSGQINHALQADKTKEAEKLDKKQAVKDRESMAGAQQTEAKHKKEEVTKTAGRFKAYKAAYEYLLGEEPEEQEIEEDMRSASLEEEEEVTKTKARPTMEEIERYNARGRFKAKTALLLGEDFDEEEPYEEENIFNPETRLSDTIQKLELAKHAFNSLNQYINDSIGAFDFDRLDDIRLLIRYGMPEDAVLKFIFLQQLARSGTDFANVMDMSVIMYKLKHLGIEKTDEEAIDLIKTDYETLKKLKYTVAGFIYIPLHEVMVKIEDDLKLNYRSAFNSFLEEFQLEEFPDLSQKLTKTILLSLRKLVNSKQNEIINCSREKQFTVMKVNQPLPPKTKTEFQEKINLLTDKISALEQDLTKLEIKITSLVLIYSFLNSGQSISEFNREFPWEIIHYTLNLLRVRHHKKEITTFLRKKINLYSLTPGHQAYQEPVKKSIESFETKIKSAVLAISKQPPPKQQQILKNIRTNPFDTNAEFYWLRQKNLSTILETCDDIIEVFNQ